MQKSMVRRILVVEDLQCSKSSLTLRAEFQRHEICNAYNVQDALQVAHEFHPEFVFVDLDTPGLDAHGLARALRSQTWGRKIILIALSGCMLPQTRRRSLDAGFDDFFIKPPASNSLDNSLTPEQGRFGEPFFVERQL